MNGIIDHSKKLQNRQRDRAIQFVKSWTDKRLKIYVAPTRAGTQRGDPIGFPRQKYKALLLSMLYPCSLKIKEIAELAEVSKNVLAVWRTQDDFKEAFQRECRFLGETIAGTIQINIIAKEIEILQMSANKEKDLNELKGVFGKDVKAQDFGDIGIASARVGDTIKILKSQIEKYKQLTASTSDKAASMIDFHKKAGKKVVIVDDSPERFKKYSPYIQVDGFDGLLDNTGFFISVLLWLNHLVWEPVLESITNLKEDTSGSVLGAVLGLGMNAYLLDGKSFYEWESNPSVIKITKKIIEGFIENLTSLSAQKQLTAEEIRDEGQELKKYIFDKLDILAGIIK